MDLKCKNCGQFLDENDKFCRFCGCPAPKKEEPKKQSIKEMQNAIEESKVVISEKDLSGALGEWNYDDIKIKSKGTRTSIIARSYALIIAMLIVIIAAAVCIFVVKSNDLSPVIGMTIIMLLVFTLFIALIFLVEALFKIKQLGALSDRQIVIPKYSMKKLPLFELGGYVFEMDIDKVCPECDEEIKGDIHIEKIHDTLVAICNYNRKHFYRINEAEFFDKYLETVSNSINVNDVQNIDNLPADTVSGTNSHNISANDDTDNTKPLDNKCSKRTDSDASTENQNIDSDNPKSNDIAQS